MKRIFTLAFVLLFLSILLLPEKVIATAEGTEYLEIDRANVYLCENTARKAQMFVIPRTFYVRVIERNYTAEEHLVEYNGVEGLIKISSISGKIVQDVENPYYTEKRITAHTDEYLYALPRFDAKTDIKASGASLPYLGKTQGESGSYGTSTWFAVLYAGSVRYIHAEKTNNIDLLESTFAPVHPNSVRSDPSSEAAAYVAATNDSQTTESTFDTVRLLLILGMIVPVLIILFVLFRPRRRRRVTHNNARDRRYSRDEDEYDEY